MANEVRILVTAQDNASAPINNVKQNVASMALGFGAAMVATGALTTAMDGLRSIATSSVSAFLESEQVTAKLNAVLKSTGGVAGVTASQVEALSASLQSATGIGDEMITSAQTMLLTFTNISKDVFPQATESVLDMAQAFGMDASSAAITLGKALNDPIAGVTALRRVGVQLTEAQETQIRNFVAVGDAASAQKVILGELSTEVGGVARAMGDTAQGQMNKFREAVGNIQEKLGEAIVKGFQPLLEKAVLWAESDEALKMTEDMATAMGGLAKAAGLAADAVGLVALNWKDFANRAAPGLGTGWDILLNPGGKLWSTNQPALPNLWPGDTADPGADAGRGEGNPFAAALASAQGGGMGSAAASAGLLADLAKRSAEELAKAQIEAQKAQADLWVSQVAPALERGSAGARAVSEAEQVLAEQRDELMRVTHDMQRQFMDEQVGAFLEGGTAQVEAVKASQAVVEAKTRETAQALIQQFGIDMPTALSAAFANVRSGIDGITQAAKQLQDFGLGYIQQLGQRNVRFTPGVLESIAKSTNLNSFDGGGYVAYDQLALVHAGERVLTPEQQAAGGVTVINNITVGNGVVDGASVGVQIAEYLTRAFKQNGAVLPSGIVAS